MLYNGEEVGSGDRSRGGRRGRPARGHPADRARPAERDLHGRPRRAGDDVLPGRGGLHGKDRVRRGDRRRRRHRRLSGGERAAVAEAKGVDADARCRVVVLDRERNEELIERAAGGRARRCILILTVTWLRPSRPPARDGRRPDDGHRRHTGGRHRRGGPQVPRRRALRQALAARRRGAPEARRRRLRHRPGADDWTDLVAGENVFFAATGVTAGALLEGCPLLAGRRRHGLDRDAITLGHRPPGRGDARAREAHRPRAATIASLRRCSRRYYLSSGSA